MSDFEKLRAEFLAESEDTLEAFQRDVSRLRPDADGPDLDVVDRVFRTAHSLKGVCGMFGLHDMTSVSHALENVFDALRSGRVQLTAPLVDLLHQGIETLYALLAHANGQRDSAPDGDVIARIDAFLAGHAREPEADPSRDPLARVLRELATSERASLLDAARAGLTVAVVGKAFPEAGFEDDFRELLQAARRWGTVHGTVSDPPRDGSFRLQLAVSGAEGVFHLMKEVGPLGADAVSCDAGAALGVERPGAPAVAPAPSDSRDSAPLDAVPAAASSPGPPTGPTLRLPVERVDRLLSDLGEVLHAKMALDEAALEILDGGADRVRRTEFSQSLRSLDRRIRALQNEILRFRMIRLGPLFQRLERALREACRVTGKEARLVTEGEGVELDRSIVERLSEPLVHLIRNAVDHGLEDEEARVRAGKDPVGTITLRAAPEGGRTVIELGDDGAGLDFDRILRKARERGLVAEDDDPTRSELRELVFRPGFTVRDEVGPLSGRGVGLDAVRAAVAELGGGLTVTDTAPGTTFRLRIPTTLAVTQALMVEAAGRSYLLPLSVVSRVERVPARSIEDLDGDEVAFLDGAALPVVDLGRRLGGEPVRRDRDRVPAVVLSVTDSPQVLLVDRLGRQREVVVRSLGDVLPPVPGVAGSTELADGRTILILDPSALANPHARPTPPEVPA